MRISAFLLIFNICLGVLTGVVLTENAVAKEDEFSKELSEHFIINYQNGVDKHEVIRIKNLAEKYYRTVTQEFHLVRDELWVWDNRAKIFIAKDKKNYLEHFNCFSWSDACVDYRNKLIYTFPNQTHFSSILVHELTHVIFREYVGRNSLPLWIDEGMATYMEDKHSGRHYSKRMKGFKKVLKENKHIEINQLLAVTTTQLSNSSEDFVNLYYLESFSMVNFIISKYGRYNFSRFLSYLKKGYNLKEAMAKIYLDFKDFKNLEIKWKRYYLN